jgi:hypothetical protein
VTPGTREPARVERSGICLDGRPAGRLIVILRAIGCTYARRPAGGCAMCGFQAATTRGVPVSAEDLAAQLDSVVDRPELLDGVGQVDLFNSGSFFADGEVPPRARERMLRRLGGTGVRRVLVESRPEYVRRDAVGQACAWLGSRAGLEVGIGLESADERVREVLVKKGFGREEFEQAIDELRGTPARLLVYLLLKPMGLDEREAIEDAVASAKYVFAVAAARGVRARAAFQPTFVAPGTALEQDFLAGRYMPPRLRSVVEVVRRTRALGEITVGMSDEGLDPRMVPAGCERCTPVLRRALAEFNRTQDARVLDGPECDCE